MNYYISDLHLGHANVIKFDNRPFVSIEEMENKIISNWNSVVKNDDIVYHLGDFCWGKEDEWLRLLPQLNGNKFIIKGNHDLKNYSSSLKKEICGIDSYKELTDSETHVILCHYPILMYKGAYHENACMLYGHVHTTREQDLCYKYIKELRQSCKNSGDNQGNLLNVGCMMPYMNYIPRDINYIKETIKTYYND